MKKERIYPKFVITKKGTRWVEGGHPWIYEGEVISGPDTENGALVDAVSENGKYLGTGFLSINSKIRIRLISKNANDKFDRDFWKRRIEYAYEYRKSVMPNDLNCFRLIFGEADSFPGLTIDVFNDLVVAQVLSIGIDKIKDIIFPCIIEVLEKNGHNIRGLFERNDVNIRKLEGLEEYKAWYKIQGKDIPSSPITEICENGIYYSVDVENGQKTGFFLDQKYNRKAISNIAKNKKVLDCFTHTGSFALNAAYGNAAHVTACDISATAIEMAQKNALRNNLIDKMDFITYDVFDLLTELLEKGGKPYDFIILDPPAFTKSRQTVKNATRGYKEINLKALKLLPRGGYLATASCSHFMEDELFRKMLIEAVHDANVELRQIEARQQSPDHPILWNVPETDYLKFYIFQVV